MFNNQAPSLVESKTLTVMGQEPLLSPRLPNFRDVQYPIKAIFLAWNIFRKLNFVDRDALRFSLKPDMLKLTLKYGLYRGGRRLVGLGLKPSKLAIPGSNPGDRTRKGSICLSPR